MQLPIHSLLPILPPILPAPFNRCCNWKLDDLVLEQNQSIIRDQDFIFLRRLRYMEQLQECYKLQCFFEHDNW